MNYDAVIASAVRDWPCARDFERLFPNAEHTIVAAQHDFYPDGWKPAKEWISRAHLHDRYVVWLVVPIEIAADHTVSELDLPAFYVVEVHEVVKSRDDVGGPEWEMSCSQFQEDGWRQFVEMGGDLAAAGLEMTVDAPVDRFATFWRDTRPVADDMPPEGLQLQAPFRFAM